MRSLLACRPLVAFACVAVVVTVQGQDRPASRSAAASVPALTFDPTEQSIEDLQQALESRRVTSRQLVEAYLARIAEYDQQGPALNAIKTTNPLAREAAEALDAERASRGARGPLHGIPVLVKDNYETIEMPTTAGSVALATFHPRRDAFQVERLKAAGAIVLGKTNMHELASGITSIGSSFGQVKNPYDLGRNPGGSSGGTGAAIAANFAAAGMGSETCGSIHNPASHNNLVGLRGTRGLSSRSGIVPLSSTQDIGGPIARSIPDLAIVLDATVGPDPMDPSTSVSAGRIPSSYRARLSADALKGARLGVVRSLFGSTPDEQDVSSLVQKAVDALKGAGAEVVEVTVPGLDDLLRDSSMINADFKFDLAEYLAGAPGAPVKSLGEILDRGLFHTSLESGFRTRNASESRDSDQARRARIKRTALRQALEAVLDEHRVAALVYPTLRRKPARLGDGQGQSNCQLSAVSGLPALGVPAGFTDDGLPIGMDLLGRPFDEAQLLSLGYAAEQTLKLRRPPFSTPGLINGKRPQPSTATLTFPVTPVGTAAARNAQVTLDLTYDETAARISYTMRMPPAVAERVTALWIHGGTVEKPGAARQELFGAGRASTGTVAVTASDRADLAEGRLILRLYLKNVPGSAHDVSLPFGTRIEAIPSTGGEIRITPIVHSSVQIEHAGTVIQIDPWSVGDLARAKAADLVLVTDDVGHHLDVKAIARVRKPGAPVVIAANGKAQVPDGTVLANGQSVTAAGIQVEAVAAYDITPGAPEHPKGEANGYVITLGGRRIYVAGVTECVPEVKALKNIDVAFIPMNIPPGRMTPREAAACTKLIDPTIVYVYHYDQDFASRAADPKATPRGLPGGITVAQSLQEFREAMRGARTQVRTDAWYP
jgi:amidase